MKISLIFIALLLISGCAVLPGPGDNLSQVPPGETYSAAEINPEASAGSRGEGEFLEKAYAMGYSDQQLELLRQNGVAEELVLDPESQGGHGPRTSDGNYVLCGYPINFLGSCTYLLNVQTGEISILPDWQNGYATFDFLSDEAFYAAIPQVGGADYEAGVRFYRVDQPKEPYAVWNLTDSSLQSEEVRVLLSTYDCKEGEMILAAWCEIPAEWGGWVREDTETYWLTLLDYQGNVVKALDTGIQLHPSNTGIAPPNFDKPNDYLEPREDTVYFDLGDTRYLFNYISGEISPR